jgi:hypothetical protein
MPGYEINDGDVLELGEHAEHLKHHLTGRRTWVEWLGR